MSSARSEHLLRLANGEAVPLIVQRHARARRMRLRFDGLADRALLTIPTRATLKRALAWAGEQSDWIEGQRGRAQGLVLLGDGTLLPVEGEMLRVVATGGTSRQVRRDGDRLLVGGPAAHAGARVVRWLKAQARAALAAETQALAATHGLPLGRVSIGDPRGRWGSCSARGDIRYSWRLILAPPFVRLATVAHEVAHLRHMNHGPAFHAFVRMISAADPGAARDWLRHEGASLHCYRDGA